MKKFLAGIAVLVALVLIPVQLQPQVKGTSTQVSVKKITVTSSRVNLRSGAGIDHKIVKHLSRGTTLDVLGKVGNWYVVKTTGDDIGCVTDRFVKPTVPAVPSKPTKPTKPTTPTKPTDPTAPVTGNSQAMQNEMLEYVNDARSQAGVAPLTLDSRLSNGAYLKSKDMADNDYFSHTSSTYGSPFQMMQSLGISFSAAGENIAMNSSVKGAFTSFMNSSGHRANILNRQYHKAGFGFVQTGSYLYVTQWFTD